MFLPNHSYIPPDFKYLKYISDMFQYAFIVQMFVSYVLTGGDFKI